MNIVALAGELVEVTPSHLVINTATDTGRVNVRVSTPDPHELYEGHYAIVLGMVQYRWVIDNGYEGRHTTVVALKVKRYDETDGTIPAEILASLGVI